MGLVWRLALLCTKRITKPSRIFQLQQTPSRGTSCSSTVRCSTWLMVRSDRFCVEKKWYFAIRPAPFMALQADMKSPELVNVPRNSSEARKTKMPSQIKGIFFFYTTSWHLRSAALKAKQRELKAIAHPCARIMHLYCQLDI